jgi:hypothetical protein
MYLYIWTTEKGGKPAVMCRILLWYVDPLVGNDHEISNYVTAAAK